MQNPVRLAGDTRVPIRALHYAAAIALSALLAGCGPKVMVPPNVDLSVYQSVGIVDFTSNAQGNLADYATQKFLELVTSSQPAARIIEIGSEQEVLEAVDAKKMDLAAVKAIGEHYGVAAVITGDLNVSDVKPRVGLSPDLSGIGIEAEIEASLTAKLIDTYDGATTWTSSSRASETVAHVNVLSGGNFYFNADDPEKAYGELVDGLVVDITYDLRVRYERQ
jgi:hypothetical protein